MISSRTHQWSPKVKSFGKNLGDTQYRIRAHGKDKNTHGTAFAVRILIECTAKGAQRIFTR
jgi:hypothetical protein